jgi:hypothetical protein
MRPTVKRLLCGFVCVVAFWGATALADSRDDIRAALQKLSDSPNYSWKTKMQGGFVDGTAEGKTEKNGYTWLSLPFGDGNYQIVIKGDKAAVQTDDGWESSGEALASGSDPPSPETIAARIAQNFRCPADQVLDELDNLQNIQKTDSGYKADFSDEAAKRALLFRPRHMATTNPDNNAPQMDASNAKASIQITLKDGQISQIQLHTTGTVTFDGDDRDVDRTMTTDISDVGTTTTNVPGDAKAKLQ